MAKHRRLSLAVMIAFAAVLTFPSPTMAQAAADALFVHAKAEAKQEHKNILLVFSASWCGPCKLYERFLEDPQMQPITDKAFVVLRIDVGERKGDPNHADTPGGADLRSALGAQKEPGFPFLIMTGENGKPIVNSYRNGNKSDNVGYPALPQEIDWYIQMLKRGAPSLSPAELAATHAWLQKHSPH